ncbi:hypothetical protein ACWGI9_41950 [Streptomyces sp. NPDC054833]
MDELRKAAPRLAEQFANVCAVLSRTFVAPNSIVPAALIGELAEDPEAADVRRRATEDFERLVERIRQLPGYDRQRHRR